MNKNSILQGDHRFRDLGGVSSLRGGFVRRGALYRGGILREVSSADEVVLGAIDFKWAFDLRSEEEQGIESHAWIEARGVERVAFQKVDISGVQPVHWKTLLRNPEFGSEQAHQLMCTSYGSMPKLYSEPVSLLFKQLSERAEGATLIHCTAGKDRTGFVSAMLLLALGVHRDDVLSEYLLSNVADADDESVRKLLAKHLGGGAPTNVKVALQVMGEARAEYLLSALAAINDQWGSLERYLEATGLDSTRRQMLEERMLDCGA
jgi:protein-tyrosine phosphatase